MILRHALDFSAKSRDEKLGVLRKDLMFLRKVVAMSPPGRKQARRVPWPNSDDTDIGEPNSDGLEGDNQEPGDVDLEAADHSQTDEVGCEAASGNECEGFFGDEFQYRMAHSYDENFASSQCRPVRGLVSLPPEGETPLRMRLPVHGELFCLRSDPELSDWARRRGYPPTSRLMGYFATSDEQLLDTRLVEDPHRQAELDGTSGMMSVDGKCKSRVPCR